MYQFNEFKKQIQKIGFLTDTDCELFEKDLKTVSLKNKQTYLEEGRTCKRIAFIVKGVFRLFYTHEGKEISTHFFSPNQFMADYSSFLTQQPSKYSIQALSDAELIVFNVETLQAAYLASHNWERFGRVMAEQSFIHTLHRSESFLFMSAEERYLDFEIKYPELLQVIPGYHIASFIGVERESLSRIKKKISGIK
ncbi:MAG: Crp/Fnr family transcriptional regulator [Fibrobacterales bacterium]